MTWDTRLYLSAHDYVTKTENPFKISARVAYLCNMVLNVVTFPLAIIAVTFGSLHAFCTFNLHSKVFVTSRNWIIQKTNHVILSAIGVLAPGLAYKYRDFNFAPYVILLRVVVITAGFIYALRR